LKSLKGVFSDRTLPNDLGGKSLMLAIWQKVKVGLLIGMLYTGYILIKSSRALKRLEMPRFNWGTKR
jgi:hypothetical protein